MASKTQATGRPRGNAKMCSMWNRIAGALVALWVSVAGPAAAQDTQDGQLWMQLLAIGTIGEDWRAHVEVQPRVFDNATELGLTIGRFALGRQLSSRVSAWAGYAWVPRTLGPETRHEQRLWQQLSIVLPTQGQWASSVRVRLEQRWLDPWLDTSHRLRVLVRGQRPLGSGSAWSVATYDELMVTLDRTARGPVSGFDRNRLYGGLARRVSSQVSAEVGYIWEHAALSGPSQRNDHVTIAVMNLTFPRR